MIFIANPLLVYVGKKVALDVATDKRTWVIIASIITGILMLFMIPIILIASSTMATNIQMNTIDLCFNEEEIPEEIGTANALFIESVRLGFEKIDTALDDMEVENSDDIFIKSVYYTLQSDGKIVLTENYYSDFVEAFFDYEYDEEEKIYTFIDEKEDIYSNLETNLTLEISDENKKSIDIVYNYIMYGTIPNGYTDFSGVPPEALQDGVFRQLMTEATKYIGFPYTWGGSTPQTSFDCSGYICWVYTQSGVYNLPRTTAQGIYDQCTPIPRSEAKPGDLVFFTRTYVTSNPVSHIGIYVGDGKMLHCGSPIGYADIDSSYWSSHYYSMGRLPINN